MCRNYLISLLLYSFVGVSIQEDLWYSYQFDTGHGNRRELYISKVDAVDNFKTQENVLEWRSLSLKNKSIALGMTANGVTILQVDKIGESFATNETHTPMNATVVDAAIFKYWKRDTAKSEIIAVVAVDAQHSNHSVDLLWFRLNSFNKLIKIWKWSLGKKITHLNVFKLIDDGDKYNILIANDRYENYTTTDWYQFHLGQHNDYWLKQAIRLETPTNSTAISTHGSKTYLSIPQNDKLRIFSLEEQNTHFVNCYNFSVSYVSFVTSFKVAFQSYIAIDGHAAGIYKFGSDKSQLLIKQNVDHANLHGIDFWLAIPISTYRDEEILIAERSLDFNTHKSHAIQVIIHHGGRFVLHEEMTCDYYGEVSNGLNCLVEEDNDDSKGIKGSTFLTVNDTLGVLVPNYQKATGLFVVHTEMKELKSPLEIKLIEYEQRKKGIEEKIQLLKEKQQSEDNFKFPTKKINLSHKPMEGLDPQRPSQAANRDNIVSQSAPLISLNMDEITARVSALQESINSMMKDLPLIPTLEPGRTQYDTLVLNGLVEVQSPSNIQTVRTGTFNGASTDKIFGDIYHIHNEQPINGHKTFANIRSNEVEFDAINGIPTETLMFKTEPLVFHGDVVLDGELIVNDNVESEKINNKNLQEEIVYFGKDSSFNGSLEFDSLIARQTLKTEKINKFPIHHNYQDATIENHPGLEITFDNIYLPGNLTVDLINGENFNNTLQSLCLKNMDCFIPNTTVIKGDVIVQNEAFAVFLNGLKYPQEYVLSKANTFSHISGEKTFTNQIVVGELTTAGTVNGIDTNDVVTLSKPQNISGKMHFTSLDVTNNLELQGDIIQSNADHQIQSKPTMQDTNEISSDINFKTLEVTGKIIIEDKFNGTNLEALLADIVYKDEIEVEINSVKKFPLGLTVLKNLQLASSSIKDVNVNTFIHKETEQVLNINQLNGSVVFENILLTGLYDDINIIKLDQESVKLSGEQFISSELVFEEDLETDELDIKHSLNDVPLEKYLYSSGKIVKDVLNIDELTVENLIVQKDLVANQENFNIKEFDETRFSLTKDQVITVPYDIKASRIPNLQTQFVNGYDFKDIFDLDSYGKKIMDLLIKGKLAVKELIVDDSLIIYELNQHAMEDIMKMCLSAKDSKGKQFDMNFENVRFGDLTVEKINGIDFLAFYQNLVFKDEENIEITGHKVYLNGFEVKNYIQTSSLNNMSIYDILRKNEHQEILSPLIILGPVTIEGDCQLKETLNHMPIENITNAFKVIDDNTYQIGGDVLFSKGPIIEDLQVNFVNGVKVNELFKNLVYINSSTLEKVNNITFINKVDITGNLNTESVNGIDLSSFKDEVVLITQDGVMQNPVTFTNDVYVKDSVQIETDLYTSNIQGVSPSDWSSKAIFINKGRINQHLNFQSAVIESDVNARFLNNINLTSLIPLKSDFNINGKLTFDELASIKDIKVINSVNSRNLQQEFINTVMSHKNQVIKEGVSFKGNVVVREYLDIRNLVNDHDLANVVTTDENGELRGNYRFLERAIVNNDIIVSGLVNSINVTKWMLNSVKKSLPEPQLISNAWVSESNIVFKDNVTGNGNINGLDIHKMAADVESRQAFKYNVEKDLVDNYQKICSDINSVIATTKQQIYSFKYLDYKQFIELEGPIEFVHQFEHSTKHYLLIKDKGCTSKLFIWMEEYFTLLQEQETGLISQVVTVKSDDSVYLVTRDFNIQNKTKSTKTLNNERCNIEGSNVWKFDEEKLVLIQKLNDQTLLHESRIPGIFYSIESGVVLEYRLSKADDVFYSVQKWSVPTDNAAFLEQGLKTGLSIRNGRNIYKLQRQDVPIGIPNDEMAIGSFTSVPNTFIPGRSEEMLLLNVGYPRWKKMMAVATHEETSVMGKLDFIKIYEDPFNGKVFHKVPTFKPSSMVSLEFAENGETLLVFLENNELLQIYEYKGVEGFKLRAKANVEGDKIVRINLPCGIDSKPRSFLGLINKNHFGLLEAVMDGDQMNLDQLTCKLN